MEPAEPFFRYGRPDNEVLEMKYITGELSDYGFSLRKAKGYIKGSYSLAFLQTDIGIYVDFLLNEDEIKQLYDTLGRVVNRKPKA